MKSCCPLIILFCIALLYQASAQNSQSNSTSEWKLYTIGKSGLKIKFPKEPSYDVRELNENMDQYTRKVYLKDSKGFNFVYFISVINYKTVDSIDSAAFINAATTIVNSILKNSYNFTIRKESALTFKNCIAKSVNATVKFSSADSTNYNGLSVLIKNQAVFMYVMTDPGYVDTDKRISQFFDALTWED
jgi:hypothetical protein